MEMGILQYDIWSAARHRRGISQDPQLWSLAYSAVVADSATKAG
jgi:hypothetical protein